MIFFEHITVFAPHPLYAQDPNTAECIMVKEHKAETAPTILTCFLTGSVLAVLIAWVFQILCTFPLSPFLFLRFN